MPSLYHIDMASKPSLVFFGSDEFAQIVLKKVSDTFLVVDKPPADLGVVASYGKIIPKKVIQSFPHGILNVHPSLLPKYRGPSPIQTAILNGDAETGVTIMKMDEQIDHGPILVQKKVPMTSYFAYGKLEVILAEAGAELLTKIIPDYIAGKIELKPQDHSRATYTKMLTRDDGKVDLEKDAPEQIYNKFRAYEGWPGVFMYHVSRNTKQKIRVKILNCKLIDGKLEITQVQPEGRKIMSLKEFENGHGKLQNS